MLNRCLGGFGALALNGLLGLEHKARAASARTNRNPGALPKPLGPLHYPAQAKSVIYLYMEGGPSQVDTFDYKPELQRRHGQELPFKMPSTVFNTGNRLMASPFEFARHGQSATWISELFPHLTKVADELTVINSLHHSTSNHTSACYFSHSGQPIAGHPSMGSWITYGLGSENANLPGFVVLDCGQSPSGGVQTWGNGFLPAQYQGAKFLSGEVTVEFLDRKEKVEGLQASKMAAIRRLNLRRLDQRQEDEALEAVIASYEKAARMQYAVPELMDYSDESEVTRKMYGVNESHCSVFGSRCLIARRLVERGVRFVEVFSPPVKADRWDQHGNLKQGISRNAAAVDQPIAALIRDLKARGLLDETIVLWGGEFGRTPVSQGGSGRDHNPFGYTVWVAGGGFKPGIRYGSTDPFGYYALHDKVHLHDLHATILHQMGVDHELLTYRYAGRDFRLTDVHGFVVADLIEVGNGEQAHRG